MTRWMVGMTALGALLLVGAVGATHAAPIFGPGLNTISATNFEIEYRPTGNCAPTACEPSQAGDPVGYQRVNPLITNNVNVGDVFVGILSISNITSLTTTWNSSSNDQFSGYFALQVANVFLPPADPWSPSPSTRAHIDLKTGPDPFGILVPGESLRLWTQSGAGTTQFTANSTAGTGGPLTDIINATDGALWGSLGIGNYNSPPGPDRGGNADTDGFVYVHADVTVGLGQFSGNTFDALNFILNNSGLTVRRINDPAESEVGGTTLPPATGNCLAGPTVTCTDIFGEFNLQGNAQSQELGGGTVWQFGSGDKQFLFVAPAPASLILLGLGLIGLAGGAGLRRRSR